MNITLKVFNFLTHYHSSVQYAMQCLIKYLIDIHF